MSNEHYEDDGHREQRRRREIVRRHLTPHFAGAASLKNYVLDGVIAMLEELGMEFTGGPDDRPNETDLQRQR